MAAIQQPPDYGAPPRDPQPGDILIRAVECPRCKTEIDFADGAVPMCPVCLWLPVCTTCHHFGHGKRRCEMYPCECGITPEADPIENQPEVG